MPEPADVMIVRTAHPRERTETASRDGMTFAIVVVLLVATAAFLYFLTVQSNATFERGIALAEAAFKARAEPTRALIQQIYLLGLAHQVVTFKATALIIGALIAILGGLFVLRTAEVQYNAELGGGAWKLSLGTSSPGLVMITLGCGLVALAVISKVHAPDGSVSAEPSAPPLAGDGPGSMGAAPTAASGPDAYDAIVRQLREQSASEGSPSSPSPGGEAASGGSR